MCTEFLMQSDMQIRTFRHSVADREVYISQDDLEEKMGSRFLKNNTC